METQIEKKQDNASILSVLQSEGFKKQIENALPKHLDSKRIARTIMTEFRKIPKLIECNKMSVLGSIMKACQLGLEIGDGLGHSYLIPYKRECNLIIGYKGYIDLAMRSNKVISITCRSVRKMDHFEIEYGLDEKLIHKPNYLSSERGELCGFYAIVSLKSGGKIFEFMTVSELEKFKKDNPFWNNYYEEMAKKTVLRRLFKTTPLSPDIQEAVIIDEKHESGSQSIEFKEEIELDDLVIVKETE